MKLEQHIINLVVMASFFVAICLPLVDSVVRIDRTIVQENRTLAEKPRWEWAVESIRAYPARFEQWYNDHFGFRNLLIYALSRARYDLFHVSPNPEVIIGKEDWLYHRHCERMIPVFRGSFQYSDAQLEFLKSRFERQRDELSQKGILYALLIAPNKESIYPEFMPSIYTKFADSNLEQFINYMRANSSVSVIDVRPAMIRNKHRGPLYFKSDMHWNKLGALIAAEETFNVLSRLHQKIEPRVTIDAYNVSLGSAARSNGLSRLMGLQDYLLEPNVVLTRIRGPMLSRRDDTDFAPWPIEEYMPVSYEHPEGSLPRAVLFHDSFGITIGPFLAEGFSRLAMYRQKAWTANGIEMSVVEYEHPDIVLEEIIELIVVGHLFPPELDLLAL